MISSSDISGGTSWGDEPVVMEVAMRLYAQLCSSEVVRSLEEDGWEPGELHRILALRAIAAAGTFADAMEELRASRKEKRRRAAS